MPHNLVQKELDGPGEVAVLQYSDLIAYGIGLLVIYFLVRMLVVPMRWLFLLVYNGVIGGLILWIINLVGGYADFHLALNPMTALAAGFLGIPGVALLAVLKYLV